MFFLGMTAPTVVGLDHQTQALFEELFHEWQARRPRNVTRGLYKDMKQDAKHLGISIPPALQAIEVVVGLPEMAVEGLASRCMWDGIVSPTNSEDPFELGGILDDNRFDIEFPQSVDSAMTYSTSFISTSLGDVTAGEPVVKVMVHSAMWSAGVWDTVRRAMRGFLSVNSVDDLGQPKAITLMTPFQYLHLLSNGKSWYLAEAVSHNLGRVPAEPLPYKPTLDRPFGQSRINRAVMNLTDRALRTLLRLEVHSELFSAPKLMLLGADSDTFLDAQGNQIPLFTWYMSRMNAVPGKTGDDGKLELPTLEQIAQSSPQPHVDGLRAIYTAFSGETKIPLNSLGVVQDNPASAEAMYAMNEDRVVLATNFNRVATYALNRVMQNIVMLRDGLSEITPELRQLSQRFRNPAMPSIVSQSDAMVKQIAAIPELAQSDVALEELGYTEEQIMRIRADIRRTRLQNQTSALVQKFAGQQATEQPAPALTE